MELKHETNKHKKNDPKNSENTDKINPLDTILDEIDVVLEQNAEEFVQGFVQKGGQ